MKSCCGFTLIEIMLAVMIAVMILLVAVPSLSGVFAEQELHQSYDRLTELAQQAQRSAMSKQEAYVLEWGDGVITLHPAAAADPTDGSIDTDPSAATPTPAASVADDAPSMRWDKGETCDITFPAALDQPDDKTWTFWPTGTCEPALITYTGPHGTWIAQFDPLTVMPTFKKNAPR